MKRTRWKGRVVGGLLGLAALGGCKQQLFLEPADYQDAIGTAKLARLETHPHEAVVPPTLTPGVTPATVLDPARPPRPMHLKEAIAIALEQGTIGGQSAANAGNSSDQLPQFTGRGATGTDTIKAFALDPALAGAEIERALSKFDARWISSITWNKQDQPTLSLQQSFSNGDSATFQSTLAKPLPTGGVAGITFSTQYLNLSNPPPPNTGFVALTTSYTPRLQFTFEQPLLQGFGVMINQLLPSHPGSQLLQLRPSGGQGSEGILITRIRHDQQQAQFDSQVNFLLLNVETAYWNLYSAYYTLAAQEEGLKQSLEGYVYFRNRAQAGAARTQDALQARAQYELFRGQVIRARGDVLNAERQLRNLLGMRNDDGVRIVPVDEPTIARFHPDYTQIANEALRNRPELMIQRQELKSRQLELLAQRNLRRPDLRFISSWDIAGLGPRLDGSSINENALRSLAANNFNSWQVGLRLDMPIGFRDANALVRQAQLNVRRAHFQLEDSERKAIQNVDEQFRRVILAHELIGPLVAQRAALEESLRLNRDIRAQGAIGANPDQAAAFISNLLTQQRDLADATAREFRAIADYNSALAGLEWAKGTIQQYNNVTVADGPLPPHVAKRAADHFRAREVAIKLREQPDGAACAPGLAGWQPLTDQQLNTPLPPPPTGDGIPAPTSSTPWIERSAPAPLPLNPAEPGPGPRGNAPASPPQPLPPGQTTLPAPGARPQLVPADAPPTFLPIDRVVLPRRPNATPVAQDPPAPPATGTPAPTTTFQPSDRVVLPKRPSAPPVAENPVVPPVTGIPAPPPIPGTGLPISTLPSGN